MLITKCCYAKWHKKWNNQRLIKSCSALMAAHCAQSAVLSPCSAFNEVTQSHTANAHLLRFYNTKLKPACNDLVWEINPRHAGAGAGMLRALTLSHLGERGWKGGREKPEQTQLHTQIELPLLLLLTPSTKSHKTKLIIVRQPVILVWFSKPATPTRKGCALGKN